VYAAYRAGSAADVDFIIGIPSNERHIYKSIVGDEKYEDLISKEDAYVMGYLDDAHPAAAKAVRAYVAAQPSATEAKAKIYEQFYALSTYRCAKNLAAGGCEVRLLYWDVKPLIEKFGSGTVDVLATFLGNSDMVQLYGNVLNNDLAEPLQRLFRKFESGEEIQLHNNEIKGLGAIDWKAFPEALMVSEKGFRCGPIEDRLTDVEALRELLSE
ncbi:MAG: carboxylesterase/lipase family protein, partial [Schwartzia sp.]|nr:carboxylesterase/lipase family protein [Schwartzia sp. (in: firmicutes)]